MAKDILHVVPHEQGWAVKRVGNERASSTHPTQHDAIEAARELAKERDDIVIHRPDGTIRERVTYSGGNGSGEAGDTRDSTDRRSTTRTAAVEPRDLFGVVSRVSWGAVIAGAVVALAMYTVLALLALAIGLSTADHLRGRTFTISAAAIGALIMLFSLFIGGFVASQVTVGEQRREGAVYGVLVWGAMVAILLLAGFGTAGILKPAGPAVSASFSPDRVKQELNLNDEQMQKYSALVQNASADVVPSATPKEAAWWSLLAVALSLLSAVCGGLAGTGTELGVERVREARPAVALAPRPA